MAVPEKSAAIEIIRTLRERGHEAYLVGGCVRDILLGRDPADYDVSTDATPEQVMRIFPRTWAVGAQFGVVLVPVGASGFSPAKPFPSRADTGGSAGLQPGENVSHDPGALAPADSDTLATQTHAIEVATFRSDGLYTDGRHPDQVTYSKQAKEDVQRRDFTINGLLLDPMNNQVLDYVGGQSDIQQKIIRTIGAPERRFGE